MKIDLLYCSRVGVEKLSRDVKWAAKCFVRALRGPRKIFPEKVVFLRAPPVINNDRSLRNELPIGGGVVKEVLHMAPKPYM